MNYTGTKRKGTSKFLAYILSTLFLVFLNVVSTHSEETVPNYPLETVRYIYSVNNKKDSSNLKENRQKQGVNGAEGVPVYCAQDSKGFLYVLFTGRSSEIQVFSKEGDFILNFGRDENGDSIFSTYICGLAINSKDEVFVADVKKRKIFVFNHTGRLLFSFPSTEGLSSEDVKQDIYPAHIGIDRMDNIYISDGLNGHVYVHKSDGKFLRIFGGNDPGLFPAASHIRFDMYGNVYVMEGLGACCIKKTDPRGDPVKCIGKTGSGAGEFQRISGIAIDNKDRIYATDIVQNVIQIFDLNGELIGVVKEVLNEGKKLGIKTPSYIYAGEDGLIYLIEQSLKRVTVLKDIKKNGI